MLSVRVLGELALERDGERVDLPAGRPARALLGLLARDHRLHPRADLAARLWPDVRDDSARTSLRGALTALRRSLEPGADTYLVSTRDHVGLAPEVWTDAEAFEAHVAAGRLDEAASLWRGDLLAGLSDDGTLTARDEWRERMADVLGRLAAAAESEGDLAAAVTHTRRIVALDPLGEAGQRLLIARLARAGDVPAALAAYARYADRLRTELRVAPSAETRALVDGLRDADPAPAPAPAAAPPAPPAAPAPAAASGTVTLLFTDLVGSTELLVALGDDEAEVLRRVHFGLLRDVATSHGGHEVKSLGDGLMVAFASSVDAVRCAIGIQQAVDRHNRRTGSERLRVRVGLNVGEPIRDEGDYFGTAVVVAKRLCDRAEGGQILAADLVRLLIGPRGGFTLRPLGDFSLKGLADPVPTCEVQWEPAAATGIALPADLDRDRTPLVGRAAELATLDEAWRRAQAGAAVVAGVCGEAGIGKTRLVTELCRQAHAGGATVLLGRCHEETLMPYEPFVEALRRYAAACPVEELRLQIGSRRRVLTKLVPELDAAGDSADAITQSAPGADEGERYALFEAVGSLLCEVARTRPTILVLDDLHWADNASLLLLRAVARATAEVPLLIVGTYRDLEVHPSDGLSEALAQLRRARALHPLPVHGLDLDDVGALIRERGADLPEQLVRAVATRTEGNPFFVEEILRHLGDGGELTVPESVKDLLRRRLRALDEPSRRTLAAAATLGAEFEVAILEEVVGGDPDELVTSIEAALDEHVLVPVAGAVGRFTFAHALIRETIGEQVSPVRRPGLHRRAGEALERRHADSLDVHAARLAHHFVEAGEDERALAYQLRAARSAAHVNAPETAIVHLGAAIETADRLHLTPATDERVRRAHLERGWMRWLTGDMDAGTADYGTALAAARSAGDRRLEAEALDALAYTEQQFDVARSAEHHAEALTVARELGDAALQVRILSRSGITRANNLDLAGALDAGEEALRLAEGTGSDRDEAVAIDALKLAAFQLGDLDRLEAITQRLEAIERRHGDLWFLQWTLLEASLVPLARARWDEASARLQEALSINGRVGDAFGGPLILDAVGWLERSRGNPGAALVAGREAVARAGVSNSLGAGWTRATLAWTLLDLRAAADARVLLEDGLSGAPILGTRFRLTGHLAHAHALAGDGGAAAAAASEADAVLEQLRVREGGAYLFGFGAAAALTRAHVALGHPERGEALAAPLLAAAGRSGWHEAVALLAVALAACRRARSDDTAARTHLRRAIEVADAHGLPGAAWEARAALAELAPREDATRLRAESAAIVQRLAGAVDDARLSEGLVRSAER